MANGHLGFPRNLGDPVVSSATSRPELPGYQLQASAAHSSAGERKERVNARGTAKRRQRSAAGRAAGGHSAWIVPTKPANGPRPEPGEGSEASDHGTLLRNTANASKFDQRVHETRADSSVGETVAAEGGHFAGLLEGPRLAEGSVPAHAQGRRRGRGWGDRGRLRAGPGGQPAAPARPRAVRHVPGTARAESAYSERRLDYRDSSARNSHPGGQGPAAGGRHGAGADL